MNSDPEAVREAWAERDGEYSPRYYAHRGPDATSDVVRDWCDRVIRTDARVLELGCSSGRHLSHLHESGYRDLVGIEVNAEAVDVMREVYPVLADDVTVHVASMEAALPGFPDDAFDAVYSAETLQHVHPDAGWVFDEIGRVAGDLLVTAEIENEGDGKLGVRPSVSEPGERDDVGDGDDTPDVNDVGDGLPLYYRNWRDVFEPRGFEQVGVETTRRDTVRAFRPVDR